jgi:hypothetical protein
MPGQLDPSRQLEPRVLPKLPCLIFGFWSCAIVAFGLAGMLQTYLRDIPKGKVVSTHHAKGGIGINLDNGQTAVFPDWFAGTRQPVMPTAKIDAAGFLHLSPGDVVEKPRYSFEHRVNDIALTNGRWELRFFLEAPLPWFFALFLLFSLIHACIVPATDILPLKGKSPPPEPQPKRRTVGGILRFGILRPLRQWILYVGLFFIGVELMGLIAIAMGSAILDSGK